MGRCNHKKFAELIRENHQLRIGDRSAVNPERPLAGRERDTLLTIIGVLLELIQSHKPGRNSESAVIKEMLQNYDEKPGISKRNLEQKFAEAKRVLGIK